MSQRCLMFVAIWVVASSKVCPDTRAKRFYNCPGGSCDTTMTNGIPSMAQGTPEGFASVCDLNEMQVYCLERLNWYRATNPNFDDGSTRALSPVPQPMKNPNTEMLQCINEKALSDFKLGTEAGECSHETFRLNCGIPVQINGENSCCGRQCKNLASCKASLDFCFLQMWDEGRNYAEPNSVQGGITGHYDNMVAVNFEFAVCGFAFSSTDNSGWMTQNFFSSEGVINDKCAYDCENNPDSCGTCHTEVSGTPVAQAVVLDLGESKTAAEFNAEVLSLTGFRKAIASVLETVDADYITDVNAEVLEDSVKVTFTVTSHLTAQSIYDTLQYSVVNSGSAKSLNTAIQTHATAGTLLAGSTVSKTKTYGTLASCKDGTCPIGACATAGKTATQCAAGGSDEGGSGGGGSNGGGGSSGGGDVPVYDLNNNDYALGAALRQESGGGVPIILTIAFLAIIFVCVMLIFKNGAPCGQCCERHTGGDGLPKANDSGTTTSNPTVTSEGL